MRDLIHFCPHFAAEVSGEIEPVLSDEHAEYRWCTFDEARTLLPWSGQRKGVNIVQQTIIPETSESRLLEISLDDIKRNNR
jgi:hypothetical protein